MTLGLLVLLIVRSSELEGQGFLLFRRQFGHDGNAALSKGRQNHCSRFLGLGTSGANRFSVQGRRLNKLNIDRQGVKPNGVKQLGETVFEAL